MKSPELAAVTQLQVIVREVQALVPGHAPGTAVVPRYTSGPPLSEVLSGLGYLVAVQSTPQAAGALAAGLGPKVLHSLQLVVQEWLAQCSAPPPAAAFYQQASEDLRKLGGASTIS